MVSARATQRHLSFTERFVKALRASAFRTCIAVDTVLKTGIAPETVVARAKVPYWVGNTKTVVHFVALFRTTNKSVAKRNRFLTFKAMFLEQVLPFLHVLFVVCVKLF